MGIRKIVHIDEEKCNGCGFCIPNCAEGALKIIDGKAKLVSDVYCDGLGACLGHCPQDAISIIEREGVEFDEKEVEKYLSGEKKNEEHGHHGCIGSEVRQGHTCPGSAVKQFDGGQGCKGDSVKQFAKEGHGCPGSTVRQFDGDDRRSGSVSQSDEKSNSCLGSAVKQMNRISGLDENIVVSSKLRQWPVQLALIPPNAPFFKGSDLLITADCVPFAYGNYHNDFLKGRTVVVGCPKLDDAEYYAKKLEEIIRENDLESITLLRMQVLCCGGMAYAARTARDNSGINIPIKVVTIGIEGDIVKKEWV